jgi:hypothetical protein
VFEGSIIVSKMKVDLIFMEELLHTILDFISCMCMISNSFWIAVHFLLIISKRFPCVILR